MYAIVDIETTGGHAESNGITEVAIIIHDGHQVTERYSTLINPDTYVPNYITGITGITNDMLEDAPYFDAVAKRIYELLHDKVFVAHNVNFDYSFLKYQLQQSGYDLNSQKLCTVRLSRKLFPGYRSYSLGNICGDLGIPIRDRHRAGGDAEATVILFEKVLEQDEDGKVVGSFLKKGSKEYLLPPNLPREQFDRLSQRAGVYYFHDQNGRIIYVGKAVNIRKRVGSHFTGNSPRKQKQDFLRNVHSISFTECATELMALILESMEIRKHWPEFNRAQKTLEFAFGIYSYEDRNGYVRLAVERVRKHMAPLHSYRTLLDAYTGIQELIQSFGLCPKLCSLAKEACQPQHVSPCAGACSLTETVSDYNHKVSQAILQLTTRESYVIIDKGLTADEKSCILIENGKFYGMGYLSVDIPVFNPQEIKGYITPQKENFFIRDLLNSGASLLDSGKRINFSSSQFAA